MQCLSKIDIEKNEIDLRRLDSINKWCKKNTTKHVLLQLQ